jgi:uncharacterized tellurite resistance protein B-like protein
MNRNTIEYRIALLFIYSITADFDIDESEMNKLTKVLKSIYTEFGITVDTVSYLNDAFEDYNAMDEKQTTDAVSEAILSLGETLAVEKLARLHDGILEVAEYDRLSQDEIEIIRSLEKTWGLTEE